jgi:hypothetical protein
LSLSAHTKYMSEQIRQLSDIPLPHPQIDPKIQSLVRGLVSVGVVTSSSCEGHLYSNFPYPWVMILNYGVYFENLLMRNVQPLIEQYNNSSRFRWEIGPVGKLDAGDKLGYVFNRDVCPSDYRRRILSVQSRKELEALQDNAAKLGEFLFDQRTPGLERNILILLEERESKRLSYMIGGI